MKLLTFVLIALLFTTYKAHPTLYDINRNDVCFKPQPAQIFSYHIHLLFWGSSESSTKGAIEIRDAFIEQFKDVLGQ